MTTLNCPGCGTEINGSIEMCPYCGKILPEILKITLIEEKRKAKSKKKKRSGLYWFSLIWIGIILSQAQKLQSLSLSSIIIMSFLPVVVLWGIAIPIRLIRQPKGERSYKGLIVWANIVLWGYYGVKFLVNKGM